MPDTKPIIPFGEYRPDEPDYDTGATATITGAAPLGAGYGPIKGFLAGSATALPGQCRGFFTAIDTNGNAITFAGTSTKLYKQASSGIGAWTDVSAGGGTYTTLPTSDQWQFAQFNNFVFAVQINAAPQVIDITTANPFAALGGSPPNASYIAVVNRFVVLAGLAAPNVNRIQWSGLNATTTWTSGVSQSDFQDLADGSPVQGIIGGSESGTILQASAIRRMTFAPGAPYVFYIEKLATNDGLLAPYYVTTAADRIFYLSPSGFRMLAPGGYPTPIGKERVDRTFLSAICAPGTTNILFPAVAMAATDYQNNRIYFTYGTSSSTSFTTVYIYDWVLDRWGAALTTFTGEYIGPYAPTGSAAAAMRLGGFSTSHVPQPLDAVLGNIEAVLTTPVYSSGTGRRLYVRGFRPISNVAAASISSVFCSGGKSDAVPTDGNLTFTSETNPSSTTGFAPLRYSTRYTQAKVRIAAATDWHWANGVEADVALEGER